MPERAVKKMGPPARLRRARACRITSLAGHGGPEVDVVTDRRAKIGVPREGHVSVDDRARHFRRGRGARHKRQDDGIAGRSDRVPDPLHRHRGREGGGGGEGDRVGLELHRVQRALRDTALVAGDDAEGYGRGQGAGRVGGRGARVADGSPVDDRLGVGRPVPGHVARRSEKGESQDGRNGEPVDPHESPHVLSSCGSAFFVTRGVMKIKSSVFLRLIDLFLNSQPRPGIFERPGTPACAIESFSLKMPPITAVPPSATRICVCALSVMMGGTSPTRFTKSGEELSTATSMITVPSLVICGVTASFKDAEMNSTLICVAVVLTTGIWTPCSIVAFWLFCVAMRGEERTLTSPFVSKASSCTSSVTESRTLPKLRARLPAWAFDGRLTS